jgi:hypothetical protein
MPNFTGMWTMEQQFQAIGSGTWPSTDTIVTQNLVGNFDPALSYSGSGTTVTNLVSGGTNGTLVNGVTYSSTSGGIFVLDGTNDYIDVPINLASGAYTIMGAARYTTVSDGRIFTAKNNNWLMGQWNSTTQNYFAEGWVSAIDTGASDTNWRIYAATGNTATDSWSLYVNGALSAGPNSAGSQGPNGLAIGAYGGTSEFSAGQVGFWLMYNAVLTPAQILQNYNYFKARYGLS